MFEDSGEKQEEKLSYLVTTNQPLRLNQIHHSRTKHVVFITKAIEDREVQLQVGRTISAYLYLSKEK